MREKKNTKFSCLHMTNKQLKDIFKWTDKFGQIQPCTDYEITKARLDNKNYGAAADGSQKKQNFQNLHISRRRGFLNDFLYNPEAVERSSYKMASCDGKEES